MGTAIVTIKIMPETVDINLEDIQKQAEKLVDEFAGDGDRKITTEPVAFGLKCINFIFVMNEDLGSPDTVAEKIEALEGVQSAEISDVRRALG